MIDAMYQDSIDAVLDDMQRRQQPQPKPERGFFRAAGAIGAAPFKGAAAGVTESAGFGADVVGAFGEVQAGFGSLADPALLLDPAEQARQKPQAAAARARVDSGEAFSTTAGTNLRQTADRFMPDPLTANTAEQVLAGASKFITKAVGYTVAGGGPLVGAALTGADEATAEAERLKAQGVDAETRMKAGLVQGAASAAGVLAPIAGKTALQTSALVLAGGPGSFVASNVAEKSILERGGYDKIADHYDPYDPVGLAVSLLVPAAFGAAHMRFMRPSAPVSVDPVAARQASEMAGSEARALRYDDSRLDAYASQVEASNGLPSGTLVALKNAGEKSGSTATSPAGAKGVMQFMPETWRQYGGGADITDPRASIDAAGRFMADLTKQYGGDVRAAIAHYNGGTKAGEAVRAGKAPPAAETKAYLSRVDEFLADRAPPAAQGDIDAARVRLNQRFLDDAALHAPDDLQGAADHSQALEATQDMLNRGETVEVGGMLNLPQHPLFPDAVQTILEKQARGGALNQIEEALLGAEMKRSPDAITEQQRFLQSMPGQRALDLRDALDHQLRQDRSGAIADPHDAFALAEADGRRGLAPEITDVDAAFAAMERSRAEPATASVPDVRRPTVVEPVRPAPRAPDVPDVIAAQREAVVPVRQPTKETRQEPAQQRPGQSESHAADPATTQPQAESAGAHDAALAQVAFDHPDLMLDVDVNGVPTRLPLHEALRAIAEDAGRDVQDAHLYEVAANCYIRTGAT